MEEKSLKQIPGTKKILLDIRAQQRDRNERDHNDHMERNTYADTLGLLRPGRSLLVRVGIKDPPGKRAPRTKAAHEARDERLRNAASRQYDINNCQQDD